MTTETFGDLETVQKLLAKHHGYEVLDHHECLLKANHIYCISISLVL